MVKLDFSLTPEKAIEYLNSKGFLLSFNYDELKAAAHHQAFTVAKVMRTDLLNDIHEELLASMQDGRTFKDFQRSIEPKLKKRGWFGTTEVINPSTGEVKTIEVNSRRLKTIFETNTRMAYNIAREEAMDALPLSVYRRYVSVLIATTREAHAHMHGIIKHKDDPFWINNSPLNGWGCKCKKTAYSKRMIEKKGWKISDEKLEDIASKDFAYDTRASRYSTQKNYFEKVQALSCKKAFTKRRVVLCPYNDVVKANYKKDMQQLLPSREEWDSFIDESLDTSIKHHKSMRLGYLSMIEGLESFLDEKKVLSDLILADTGSIRNLRAKGDGSKKGKVLEIDEIKELHSKIHTPDEIYVDSNILLVYHFNNAINKVVIDIDVIGKKEIYNELYSGQKYNDLTSFENMMKEATKIK